MLTGPSSWGLTKQQSRGGLGCAPFWSLGVLQTHLTVGPCGCRTEVPLSCWLSGFMQGCYQVLEATTVSGLVALTDPSRHGSSLQGQLRWSLI